MPNTLRKPAATWRDDRHPKPSPQDYTLSWRDRRDMDAERGGYRLSWWREWEKWYKESGA